MTSYHITWGAHIDAATPLEAATHALELMERREGLRVLNIQCRDRHWQAYATAGDVTTREFETEKEGTKP